MKLSARKVTSLRGNVQISLKDHQLSEISYLETGLDENSQTNLLSLDLQANSIRDIRPIQTFLNLWVLNLRLNIELVDYSPLVTMKVIGKLTVTSAPLDSRQMISLSKALSKMIIVELALDETHFEEYQAFWKSKPSGENFDQLVQAFPQCWIINKKFVDFQSRVVLLKDQAIPSTESLRMIHTNMNDRKTVFLESFGAARIRYYYGHTNLERAETPILSDNMSIVNIPVAEKSPDMTGISMFELCKFVYIVQHLNLVKIFEPQANSPILPIQKWLKLPGKQASYLVVAFQLYLQGLVTKSVVSDLILEIEKQTKCQIMTYKANEKGLLTRSTKYELMALIVTLRQVIRSNLKTFETKLNQQILEVYANANQIDEISQKSQINSIKASIAEVEELSQLIESHFLLTQDLILGQPRKHKLSVTSEKLELTDERPQLSEKLSDMALRIFDQYGLIKRYKRQNKLQRLEKLRAHLLEREKNEQQLKQIQEASQFSLEQDRKEKAKDAMVVSVYSPQLAEAKKLAKDKSPKGSQKILKGKEFKFQIEEGVQVDKTPMVPQERMKEFIMQGHSSSLAAELVDRGQGGRGQLIPKLSIKKSKSKPGSPQPVMLEPSQSYQGVMQSYGQVNNATDASSNFSFNVQPPHGDDLALVPDQKALKGKRGSEQRPVGLVQSKSVLNIHQGAIEVFKQVDQPKSKQLTNETGFSEVVGWNIESKAERFTDQLNKLQKHQHSQSQIVTQNTQNSKVSEVSSPMLPPLAQNRQSVGIPPSVGHNILIGEMLPHLKKSPSKAKGQRSVAKSQFKRDGRNENLKVIKLSKNKKNKRGSVPQDEKSQNTIETRRLSSQVSAMRSTGMSAATTTNNNTPHPAWLNAKGFQSFLPNEDIRPAIEDKQSMVNKPSPKFMVREMSFASGEVSTLMDARNSSTMFNEAARVSNGLVTIGASPKASETIPEVPDQKDVGVSMTDPKSTPRIDSPQSPPSFERKQPMMQAFKQAALSHRHSLKQLSLGDLMPKKVLDDKSKIARSRSLAIGMILCCDRLVVSKKRSCSLWCRSADRHFLASTCFTLFQKTPSVPPNFSTPPTGASTSLQW